MLARVFGDLTACVIVFGALGVMHHLDHNMIRAIELAKMRR